jgi:uncharacterized protein
MSNHSSLSIIVRAVTVTAVLACFTIAAPLARQSVRVVDSVHVGTTGDEAAHGLASSGSTTGTAAGKTWRSATGWFSYTLKIYDDSPLAIACVFAEGDGTPEMFEILVDGEKTSLVSRDATKSRLPVQVEVRLPLAETFGKTTVVVRLAARPGSRTARLLELRSVQEHLE